jgi:hypothetical protein
MMCFLFNDIWPSEIRTRYYSISFITYYNRIEREEKNKNLS